MKTRTLLLTATLLCALPLSSMAQKPASKEAGHPGPPEQKKEQLQKELQLTDAQMSQLEALRKSHQEQMKKEREALKAANDGMTAELRKPNPAPAQINLWAEKIGQAHATMARSRAEHLQEVRKLLSEEQYQKLLTMQSEKKAQHPGAGKVQGQKPAQQKK